MNANPRVIIKEEKISNNGGREIIDVSLQVKEGYYLTISATCDCEENCDCPITLCFADEKGNMGYSDPISRETLPYYWGSNDYTIRDLTNTDLNNILDLISQAVNAYDEIMNKLSRRLRRRWEVK